MFGLAVVNDSGLAQASSTASPVLSQASVGALGAVFLVIFGGFMVWYMIMRRRP